LLENPDFSCDAKGMTEFETREYQAGDFVHQQKQRPIRRFKKTL
jgi:hypothetical protein